ncbi:hypothetical protein BN903_80 [Halorubrum sp. AJ67]|nr:hypothetical protein BN903_80 [Halorubrum sp. AJ67]
MLINNKIAPEINTSDLNAKLRSKIDCGIMSFRDDIII